MADPTPPPAPAAPSGLWKYLWAAMLPLLLKAGKYLLVALVGALASYFGWRPAPVVKEVPVPVVWEVPPTLAEPGVPMIGTGAGVGRPTTGWVPVPGVIAANLDPEQTLHFANTPAGKAAMGDEDVFLWRAVYKVTNKGPPWEPWIDQGQVGSCVGVGDANTAVVCLATAILAGGNFEWKPVSAEVIYAGSRVEIGRGQIRGDGSSGAWAARWLKEYGVVPMEVIGNYDLTKYDPARARAWGKTGVPAEVEAVARQYPIKGIALVKTWADVKRAIQQGYPCSVASDQGFEMVRDQYGTCRPRGTWAHNMSINGVRKHPATGKDQGFIVNSWGPKAHTGPVSPADAPTWGFWTDAEVINSMVAQGDSFAYSDITGFPSRRIPIDWFGLAERGFKMSPLLASDNFPNRARGDSIFGSKLETVSGSDGEPLSNVKHLSRGELGAAVSLAAVHGPVPSHVGAVLRPGSPTKVAESVIRLVSVVVTAVHLGRPGPDEREHDELVNRNQKFAVVTQVSPAAGEADEQITDGGSARNELPPVGILAAPSEWPLAPDRAVVSDAVLGKAVDLFVDDRTLFLRHDRLPEGWLCLGPASGDTLVRPALLYESFAPELAH